MTRKRSDAPTQEQAVEGAAKVRIKTVIERTLVVGKYGLEIGCRLGNGKIQAAWIANDGEQTPGVLRLPPERVEWVLLCWSALLETAKSFADDGAPSDAPQPARVRAQNEVSE